MSRRRPAASKGGEALLSTAQGRKKESRRLSSAAYYVQYAGPPLWRAQTDWDPTSNRSFAKKSPQHAPVQSSAQGEKRRQWDPPKRTKASAQEEERSRSPTFDSRYHFSHEAARLRDQRRSCGSLDATPEERVAMEALALMAEGQGHDGRSREDSIVRMANLLGLMDDGDSMERMAAPPTRMRQTRAHVQSALTLVSKMNQGPADTPNTTRSQLLGVQRNKIRPNDTGSTGDGGGGITIDGDCDDVSEKPAERWVTGKDAQHSHIGPRSRATSASRRRRGSGSSIQAKAIGPHVFPKGAAQRGAASVVTSVSVSPHPPTPFHPPPLPHPHRNQERRLQPPAELVHQQVRPGSRVWLAVRGHGHKVGLLTGVNIRMGSQNGTILDVLSNEGHRINGRCMNFEWCVGEVAAFITQMREQVHVILQEEGVLELRAGLEYGYWSKKQCCKSRYSFMASYPSAWRQRYCPWWGYHPPIGENHENGDGEWSSKVKSTGLVSAHPAQPDGPKAAQDEHDGGRDGPRYFNRGPRPTVWCLPPAREDLDAVVAVTGNYEMHLVTQGHQDGGEVDGIWLSGRGAQRPANDQREREGGSGFIVESAPETLHVDSSGALLIGIVDRGSKAWTEYKPLLRYLGGWGSVQHKESSSAARRDHVTHREHVKDSNATLIYSKRLRNSMSGTPNTTETSNESAAARTSEVQSQEQEPNGSEGMRNDAPVSQTRKEDRAAREPDPALDANALPAAGGNTTTETQPPSPPVTTHAPSPGNAPSVGRGFGLYLGACRCMPSARITFDPQPVETREPAGAGAGFPGFGSGSLLPDPNPYPCPTLNAPAETPPLPPPVTPDVPPPGSVVSEKGDIWTPPARLPIVQLEKQKRARRRAGDPPAKQGKMSWAWGTKFKFFNSRKEEWVTASEKRLSGKFYTKVAKLYRRKYGFDLKDDEDFEYDIEDPPDWVADKVVNERLAPEEAQVCQTFHSKFRDVGVPYSMGHPTISGKTGWAVPLFSTIWVPIQLVLAIRAPIQLLLGDSGCPVSGLSD
ncbi:hypothetical protein B0H13DRAFT_1899648 [Mycena leptocephala]|nr:hypothetical protein B0H13DRAFT_1899648 [Mycena leptocephala]